MFKASKTEKESDFLSSLSINTYFSVTIIVIILQILRIFVDEKKLTPKNHSCRACSITTCMLLSQNDCYAMYHEVQNISERKLNS